MWRQRRRVGNGGEGKAERKPSIRKRRQLMAAAASIAADRNRWLAGIKGEMLKALSIGISNQ
jgi:hypothetical protein